MKNFMRKIKNLFLPIEKNSDGFHTFQELYDHRDALFIQLCIDNKELAWYSRRHSDGSEAFGYPWIIMGINSKPDCQITYHIDIKNYAYFDNVANKIKQLDFAPTWDRHTSKDVLVRIKTGVFRNAQMLNFLCDKSMCEFCADGNHNCD